MQLLYRHARNNEQVQLYYSHVGIIKNKHSQEVCHHNKRTKLFHDFDVGLLMRVCYPKRSYNPLSNFLSQLIDGAY